MSNRGIISEKLQKEGVFGCFLYKGFKPEIPIFIPKQAHSSIVIVFHNKNIEKIADGVLSQSHPVGVRTADCVPVLMSSKGGKFLGAVHAGWRGVAKGIIINAIALANSRLRISTKNIIISVGPSISSCCYTIGKDVFDTLSLFWNNTFKRRMLIFKDRKVNLKSFLIEQACMCGVPYDNIEVIDECTHCSEKFVSRRRDKDNQTQFSYISFWTM